MLHLLKLNINKREGVQEVFENRIIKYVIDVWSHEEVSPVYKRIMKTTN